MVLTSTTGKGHAMKVLQCRILTTGDHFLDKLAGKTVTVTKIDRAGYGSGTLFVECILDDSGLELLTCTTDQLLPIDVSMVPETHNGSLLLQQIWIFHEASYDAWFRGPPSDLAKYEEQYGCPWKDNRIFDVGRRGG